MPKHPRVPDDTPKVCTRCNTEKRAADFHSDAAHADGLQSRCKACQMELRRIAYAADPAKYNARHKKWANKNRAHLTDYQRRKRREHIERYTDYDRKRNYGLKRGEYARMLAAQNGACAVCRETPQAGKRRLHVDHCHHTGAVRALLCTRCNCGIGMFRHDEALLRSAIGYLVTHQPKADE